MKNTNEIWEEVVETLVKEGMTDVTIKTFFKTGIVFPISHDNSTYTIAVENTFTKGYLLKHTNEIERILEQICGSPKKLIIYLNSEIKNRQNGITAEEDTKKDRSGLIKEYRFDNFIVGPSNDFAHAAAVAAAENPGDADYNPLFLYGGVGLGKTHLMHAIGNYIYEKDPTLNIKYISCNNFTTEFINSLNTKKTYDFKEKYKNVDLLLLDDIQYLANKDSTQTEFFNIFNDLMNSKKQIVLCSDRKPSEIETLTDRLVSRMNGGIVADIKFPDLETRIAILEKKAFDFGINVPFEVLNLIAEQSLNNVREMEGLLKKVRMYSKFINKEITLELATEAIKDSLNHDKKPITIELIQEKAAEYFHITVEDLCSKRRGKPLGTYRQIAMYLCKKYLDVTIREIGTKFGGKEHSTVIYSCNVISELIETNPEIREYVTDIEKLLK